MYWYVCDKEWIMVLNFKDNFFVVVISEIKSVVIP